MDDLEYRRRVLNYILRTHPEGLSNDGWSVKNLSRNSSIDYRYVMDYSDLDWNWNEISYRTDLSPDFIEWFIINHPQDVKWDRIWQNAQLTDYLVEWLVTNYYDKVMWRELCSNRYLSLVSIQWLIINHTRTINWDNLLHYRSVLSADVVKWIVTKYSTELTYQSWSSISRHDSLTPDLIKWLAINYTDKIDWTRIIDHPSCIPELMEWLIINYPTKVNWYMICLRIASVLVEWLVTNYLKNINWLSLYQNSSLSLDVIKWLFINHNANFEWERLAKGDCLNLEIVRWLIANSPIDILVMLCDNSATPLDAIIWLGDNYQIDIDHITKICSSRQDLTIEFLTWCLDKFRESSVPYSLYLNMYLSIDMIKWLIDSKIEGFENLIRGRLMRGELMDWLILERYDMIPLAIRLDLSCICIESINKIIEMRSVINNSIWKNPSLTSHLIKVIIVKIYKGKIRNREDLFQYAKMDDDVLEWLLENYTSSINMKMLSLNNWINYKFIIDHPNLSWDVENLSLRTYTGIIPHMMVKSARRAELVDE